MTNQHMLHRTELDFCTTHSDVPILTLKISWSDDTSHVLVAVNNQSDQLVVIAILTRSEVTPLKWSGFSRHEIYNVQVYGLKQDTVTRQERRQNHQTTLYSIEAVKKITLLSADQTQMEEADLRIHMLDSLGSQDNFEVEVSNEEPMTHSLEPQFPCESTTGLLIIYNLRLKAEYIMMSSVPSHGNMPICHSRTSYQVRAIALTDTQSYTSGCSAVVCCQYRPCGKSKVLTIKTCMDKEDLQKLLDKAQSFCHSYKRKYKIRQFYRNQPRRDYKDILENRGGLMAKHIKDNNGDPYSPINNQINGLFFSASLDTRTMEPLPFSYFGDQRLFVPAEELFTSDTKMYFTDFYCHYETHYVTIVLTKNGSYEDRICQTYLLELDQRNNPFFTVTDMKSSSSQLMVQKTFSMVSVNKFHVEFFYTEDVDINGLIRKCGNDKVYFQYVQGKGESKKDGIPKKVSCRICNLDPPFLSSQFRLL